MADTSFPPWVYNLALVVSPRCSFCSPRRSGAGGRRSAGAGRSCCPTRPSPEACSSRRRFLGISYRQNTGNTFEQARYLLPLLPLYGAVALAARGIGRRLERQLGALDRGARAGA